MKVEVWFDFTCPFCLIGKRKLEMALEKFSKSEFVTTEYYSYIIESNQHEMDESLYSHLMKKFDRTTKSKQPILDEITEQAKEVGVSFQPEKMVYIDTNDAHRLVKFAKKKNKDKQLVDLLFMSYFNEHKNIAQSQTLVSIAKEIGLLEAEVQEILSLNRFSNAIKIDKEIAKEIGIDDIPFFIFNEKYAVTGAQPVEVFVKVLETSWKEDEDRLEQKHQSCHQSKTTYCVGDECETDSL